MTILRVAAVIGREFDLHLLQRTSRLSPARLLDVLGEAGAVGVVIELPSTPGRYSFAHELMRETLYDDLPPAPAARAPSADRAPARGAWADDLDPHLSEIAHHLYLAAPLGGADEALEYLVRAGDRARRCSPTRKPRSTTSQALGLLPRATDGGRRAAERAAAPPRRRAMARGERHRRRG